MKTLRWTAGVPVLFELEEDGTLTVRTDLLEVTLEDFYGTPSDQVRAAVALMEAGPEAVSTFRTGGAV